MADEKRDDDLEKELETIEFEYHILPSFNSYAVSGVYGGLNASGEIVVNFFHERNAIPKTQKFKIRNGQLHGVPVSEEKKSAIIRDVLFNVSLSPSSARGLARWLNEKADIYDAKLSKQKQGVE